MTFQSTHSLRSATYTGLHKACKIVVSIHALLAECDVLYRYYKGAYLWFQSTHSLRSATGRLHIAIYRETVSIHALLAECDYLQYHRRNIHQVSIHALLAECDRTSGD